MGAHEKVTLYCDGACRGNPGPSSYGFVVLAGKTLVAEGKGLLGEMTNNVAEYSALLHGLKRCRSLGATDVTVKADSELMIRQMNGDYKVRAPQLVPLFHKAKILALQFRKVTFVHVPREENSHADALANEALDSP